MPSSALRGRGWAAIERLLALVEWQPSDLGERVGALSDREFIRAVRLLMALG